MDTPVPRAAPEPDTAPAAPIPDRWAGPLYPGQKRAQRLLAGAGVLCLVAFVLLGGYYLSQHPSADPTTTGRELVPLLLLGVGSIFFATTLVLRTYTGVFSALRNTAIVYTFLVLGTLIALWGLVDNTTRQQIGIGAIMRTDADVNSYLLLNAPAATGGTVPLTIPTGMFVQSIDFTGANNVTVTGYVWQKYAPGFPKDAERGFVFPEAQAEAYGATEAYRYTLADGSELIGWYFNADLRQQFFYDKYPFDRQDVWLRLWYKDFDRGALLTPDLASYEDTTPANLPGMDTQFVFDGWVPEYSVFSYNLVPYNSNFGYGTFVKRAPLPELYFNVGLQRKFFNTYISRIIPLGVVAFLLFAVLITTTKKEGLLGLIGFNAFAVLGYCAALFFVVIIDHTQLRTALAAQGIIYLDYFYFMLYLAILMISVNAILLTSGVHWRILEANDNAVPKLLYWPGMLTILLAATVYTFYLKG